MITEFESSHWLVDGHNITLTSWYDEVRKVWQTSAPGYMHLSVVAEAAHVPAPSRREALEHLSRVLGAQLAPTSATIARKVPSRFAMRDRVRGKSSAYRDLEALSEQLPDESVVQEVA